MHQYSEAILVDIPTSHFLRVLEYMLEIPLQRLVLESMLELAFQTVLRYFKVDIS